MHHHQHGIANRPLMSSVQTPQMHRHSFRISHSDNQNEKLQKVLLKIQRYIQTCYSIIFHLNSSLLIF